MASIKQARRGSGTTGVESKVRGCAVVPASQMCVGWSGHRQDAQVWANSSISGIARELHEQFMFIPFYSYIYVNIKGL